MDSLFPLVSELREHPEVKVSRGAPRDLRANSDTPTATVQIQAIPPQVRDGVPWSGATCASALYRLAPF
jgi:hypothetical protein